MIPNACLVYSRHVKLLSSKKQRETEKEKEVREVSLMSGPMDEG